ncbi:hypothetical protein [Prevotella herbatica]|uniref:hypothetical protein n=1 Tax=Prevotella herbatica TaxID=2801997 RepID=UPI001A9341E0|nr:hypothetical protein [Prevotella herbatica]
MKFRLLVTSKKCFLTISLILLLLNTFTACSKDDEGIDKQFANTVWIHRFTPADHMENGVCAEVYVFLSDGTIKDCALDSNDKYLMDLGTYHFYRIDKNHIAFSKDATNGILIDGNHFFAFYDFYKSAYRPENLA